MSLPIQFHEAAAEETEAAFSWYYARSPKAAEGFVWELARVLDQIADSPQMFSLTESGSRRAMLRRYPFIIFFKEQSEQILVLAVAHAKRRPGYWRNRQTF